jgi:hypothetical protein
MAAKKLPRKTRGRNKPVNDQQGTGLPEDLESFPFWSDLILRIYGKEKVARMTKWEHSEAAMIMYRFAKGLREEWDLVSKICNENQDRTISVGCGFEIDRRNSPSAVKVRVNYNEKHGQTLEGTVPDPDQVDFLPLNAEPRIPEQGELEDGVNGSDKD